MQKKHNIPKKLTDQQPYRRTYYSDELIIATNIHADEHEKDRQVFLVRVAPAPPETIKSLKAT